MAWTKLKLRLLAASVLQAARFNDVSNPIGIVHIAPTSPPVIILAPAISHSKAARDETLPVDRDAAALLLRTSTRHL